MADKTGMDEALELHLRTLGCKNTVEYLGWCERAGVRATLRKSVHERKKEIELNQQRRGAEALIAARQYDRKPEAVLRELAALKTPRHLYARPYLAHLSYCFSQLKNEPKIRESFLDLLLLTHSIKGFQQTEPVITGYESLFNTYAGALMAMARRYREWKRSPGAWKPDGHNARRNFSGLARHLFCDYSVPVFLESVWFAGQDRPYRQQQEWYILAGNGLSLRGLPVPLTITKRMAHLALTVVPHGCTVEGGWRLAQVLGMGGSERLAGEIVATPLGRQFRDEPFWETVVRFLVDNPLLHPSQVGPLIDYLRYERYEPRRAGDTGRLPIQFTMKGRTVSALLARMETWHRHLAHEERSKQEQWTPSGIGEFRYEDRDRSRPERRLTWLIKEITTTKSLIAEGRSMSHCIASYAASCIRGAVSVWSLQLETANAADPLRVMTIAVNRYRAITEARGKRNATPSASPSVYGRPLPPDEAALLVRGRHVIQLWAAQERLTLPGYLTAGT